jgi:hypothetical protein
MPLPHENDTILVRVLLSWKHYMPFGLAHFSWRSVCISGQFIHSNKNELSWELGSQEKYLWRMFCDVQLSRKWFEDLVAQSISLRFLIGNTHKNKTWRFTLMKMVFSCRHIFLWFSWELHKMDYFRDGFSYFCECFRLWWNLHFLVT